MGNNEKAGNKKLEAVFELVEATSVINGVKETAYHFKYNGSICAGHKYKDYNKALEAFKAIEILWHKTSTYKTITRVELFIENEEIDRNFFKRLLG